MLNISSGFTLSPEEGGICPGDSGGALYAGDDPANLTVIGINSRFVSGQVLGSQVSPNDSYFTRLDNGPRRMKRWLTQQLSDQSGVRPLN